MQYRHLLKGFAALLTLTLLTQCNTFQSDCRAIAQRDAAIAQEPAGDYYIARRYYVPTTRFWGYIRRPGESWRTAKLVIMDESKLLAPDRGPEPPLANAVFGTDHNVEYFVTGDFLSESAYEPNSNQVLAVFQAKSYQVKDAKPGYLFRPSERYNTSYVSLFPAMMPDASACARSLRERP